MHENSLVHCLKALILREQVVWGRDDNLGILKPLTIIIQTAQYKFEVALVKICIMIRTSYTMMH
jgi:hypothetical protein